MTHPLTDKIIQAITHNIHVYDDTRPLRVDMRAAADWQLERDAEYFTEYLVTVLGWDPVIAQMRTETFKKAMRPQEDNQ